MQSPSGVLVQQFSVAESEGTKPKRLAGDLVETGVCQFAIKAPHRISVKPRATSSPSGGSQQSPDATLEGFQSGIEDRIDDLMEGPVVVGRDDEMPARLQDTEDLSQRLRQRDQPLGYPYENDELKRRIRKWHIGDVGQPRKHARTHAGSVRHRCRPFDHLLNAVDGPHRYAPPRDRSRDDTGTTSDLQNRRTGGEADAVQTGKRPAGAFLIDPAIDGSVGVDLFPVRKRGTKVLLNERVVRQAMAGSPGRATCAIKAHISRSAFRWPTPRRNDTTASNAALPSDRDGIAGTHGLSWRASMRLVIERVPTCGHLAETVEHLLLLHLSRERLDRGGTHLADRSYPHFRLPEENRRARDCCRDKSVRSGLRPVNPRQPSAAKRPPDVHAQDLNGLLDGGERKCDQDENRAGPRAWRPDRDGRRAV